MPWASGSVPRSRDPTRAPLSSRLEYRLFADVCILNHSVRVGSLYMLWAAVPWRRQPRLVWVSSIILNCPTHIWVPSFAYPRRLLFWWLGRRGCDRWCSRDSAGHLGGSRTTGGPLCVYFQAGASATPVARVWATWLGYWFRRPQSVRGSTGPAAWELHASGRLSVTVVWHVRGF